MTEATLTQPAAKPNLLSGLFARIRTARQARTTVIQLSSLSDRELDDIGITRGDIPHIARGR